MRVFVKFETQGKEIPVHYNYALQSFIYHLLCEVLPDFHRKSFEGGGRRFRLFTFSRILAKKVKVKGGRLKFLSEEAEFAFSSPIGELVEAFANLVLKRGKVKLFDEEFPVIGVRLRGISFENLCQPIKIRTLSPVVVHFSRVENGRHKTYYLSPEDPDFARMLFENLLRKAEALNIGLQSREFEIFPLRVSEKILKYKGGFIIKGWMGEFEISGDPALLQIAYDSGLGSKNSQGFGMIEIVGGENFAEGPGRNR